MSDEVDNEDIKTIDAFLKRLEELIDQGRIAEAEELFEKPLLLPRRNYTKLGLSLLQMGKDEAAVKAFEKALNLNPEDVIASANKSGALLRLGRYHEALQMAERAIELNPSYVTAYVNKSAVLYKLSQYHEALRMAERAIEMASTASDASDAYVNKGAVLSQLGKHEEAIRAFDRAIESDPGNSLARRNRMAAILRWGRGE